MARRTGRRPGNQDTRKAILAAAREAFAERGYDGASIRQIATSAGVDPALVHHYFGNKEQLFLETMQLPIDPSEVLPAALAGGVDGVGERLVRAFLGVWDSAAGGTAAALLRSAVSNEWTARMLREFVVSQILRRIFQEPSIRELNTDPEDGPLRASLVASQLVGLLMARYIIKVEPMASAPPERLVTVVGPTIQRYIAGDLS
jgi:AcrR family transcriptional regulator